MELQKISVHSRFYDPLSGEKPPKEGLITDKIIEEISAP